MTMPRIAFGRVVLLALLCILGGVVAWRAAPDVEAALFPPFTDEYLVPFAPERPDVLAERQLDRICWRLHFHKARTVRAARRAITIILQDGTRYFGEPLDVSIGVEL